jgi:hypothetical protein
MWYRLFLARRKLLGLLRGPMARNQCRAPIEGVSLYRRARFAKTIYVEV